jgi:hypothetical protein
MIEVGPLQSSEINSTMQLQGNETQRLDLVLNLL